MTDVLQGPFPTVEQIHEGSVEQRRDKERAAWAGLVKATGYPAEHDPEISAAKQALRDLGVDVDALLVEAASALDAVKRLHADLGGHGVGR
jgi:hypothetical protein